MNVKLTYFKSTSGKYYTSCEHRIHFPPDQPLFAVWEHIASLQNLGDLPGLIPGAGREFIILVEAPDHPHNHPKLILPLLFMNREPALAQGDHQ